MSNNTGEPTTSSIRYNPEDNEFYYNGKPASPTLIREEYAAAAARSYEHPVIIVNGEEYRGDLLALVADAYLIDRDKLADAINCLQGEALWDDPETAAACEAHGTGNK